MEEDSISLSDDEDTLLRQQIMALEKDLVKDNHIIHVVAFGLFSPLKFNKATIQISEFTKRRDGRAVEGAPLLREYGLKAHRGFESLSLRQFHLKSNLNQ